MKAMSAPQPDPSWVGKTSLRFHWECVGYSILWLSMQHLALPVLTPFLTQEGDKMGEIEQSGVGASSSHASLSLRVFPEEFLQSRTQKWGAEKLSFCSLMRSWLLAGAVLLPAP